MPKRRGHRHAARPGEFDASRRARFVVTLRAKFHALLVDSPVALVRRIIAEGDQVGLVQARAAEEIGVHGEGI